MRIYPDGELQGRCATYSMVAKSQLFNSLDPSPFWDRDLDRSAAELIEDEFRDKQSAGVADLWLGAVLPQAAALRATCRNAGIGAGQRTR